MREFQVMKQELQEMVHQRLDMSTELSDEAIGDVIDEVIMEKSRNELSDKTNPQTGII